MTRYNILITTVSRIFYLQTGLLICLGLANGHRGKAHPVKNTLAILCASLCLLLFNSSAIAQSVTVPVQLAATVTIPAPVQTNYYFINPNLLPIVTLTNNVIDPAIGVRQFRLVIAPTAFLTAAFQTNSYVSFYWANPQKQAITWPTNIFWLGPPPTNEVRGAVFLELLNGEIWGSR